MQELIEAFKHATGKVLKSAKIDPKNNTLTLEFEGTTLVNKVAFSVRQNSFVSFEAKPKQTKDTRLKAKEKALAPVEPLVKKSLHKKPILKETAKSAS